jgi:hypothetical protein
MPNKPSAMRQNRKVTEIEVLESNEANITDMAIRNSEGDISVNYYSSAKLWPFLSQNTELLLAQSL